MAVAPEIEWTHVQRAVEGDAQARSQLAVLLEPILRRELQQRWMSSRFHQLEDDAVQQVFVELFRERGALSKADASRATSVVPYVLGVVRNVARQLESHQEKRRRRTQPLPDDTELLASPTSDEAERFHEDWARGVVQLAMQRYHLAAAQQGDEALSRFTLLCLRTERGWPIRQVAQAWGVEATFLHRQYARARRDFVAHLRQVLRAKCPHENLSELQRELCATLSR